MMLFISGHLFKIKVVHFHFQKLEDRNIILQSQNIKEGKIKLTAADSYTMSNHVKIPNATLFDLFIFIYPFDLTHHLRNNK